MEYQSHKFFEQESQRILRGLRVADCMNLLKFEREWNDDDESKSIYNLKELAVSDVLSCSYCNVTFTDASQQRSHYKLDWHRYNLKRALAGNKSVTEDVFNSLADDVSSISGSDTERSEESDTEASEASKAGNSENLTGKSKSNRHSKAFFENAENQILSVYRCILHSKKETLKKDDLTEKAATLLFDPQKWMVVLLGGGHFAAAIFEKGEMLCHKTFHSYTVRAKQGGSQSSRDGKGGGHPKSAGASLRRYNEQTFVQHVQEILSSWSELLKQCNLILYRATGPYNRSVLFGNKRISKADPRLRNIPFPTRRATLKEVKRVYDMLSSVEVYGSADHFKNKFPPNPDKRTWSPKSKREPSGNSDTEKREDEEHKRKRSSPGKSHDRAKPRRSPQREAPQVGISSESEEGNESGLELTDITISFQDLQEYEDTVPQHIKDSENNKLKRKNRRKKSNSKHKGNSERRKHSQEFVRLQKNFIRSCELENLNLLTDNLKIYDGLPERGAADSPETSKPGALTREDFVECLNAPVDEETKNTLLHLASINGLPEFITKLLTSGADPTIKNRNKLTPYVLGCKETRNAFREFAAQFPEKYDYKKVMITEANVPEPLSEEKVKELEEMKKEKRKQKRIKEKIKKQEDKEKKNEEEERKRFLALSDREKCALAAERRLMNSSTANMLSAKPPVLSRCFQCGADITGKIAFEYGNNRFCSIPCLKAHRLKTNSYGLEI